MARPAALPTHDSKRMARADSSIRRTSCTVPVTRQPIASGLTTIQASSEAGNAASSAGWAQYEVTESVLAQPKAATPPGTSP